MKIQLESGVLSGTDVFRLVWRGWFFGVMAIFLPLFLAFGILIVLPGYTKQSPAEYFLSLFLLPLIAAGQGAGAFVLFGLRVRPPRVRPDLANGSGSNKAMEPTQ
ncbi:hypothetical protein [Steroidobacter cummioxidans]|uniref:hypothetical protein n=1 Tax=Steroidobacter cummioxidans TaxID=1803913 RepID=UPI00128FF5ED|nr:hypothetical protein [Steroidobacter cummioxidans]